MFKIDRFWCRGFDHEIYILVEFPMNDCQNISNSQKHPNCRNNHCRWNRYCFSPCMKLLRRQHFFLLFSWKIEKCLDSSNTKSYSTSIFFIFFLELYGFGSEGINIQFNRESLIMWYSRRCVSFSLSNLVKSNWDLKALHIIKECLEYWQIYRFSWHFIL